MVTIYLLLGILYLGLLLLLRSFWVAPGLLLSEEIPPFKVSVLVPFRNEEEHIQASFANLNKLTYPDLEIIWIDDHSEDKSHSLIECLIGNSQNPTRFKLIASGGIGKKSALEEGVKMALGDIILTTDADCTVPKHWVELLTSPFFDPAIQLAAGPVMTQNSLTFFQKFQQIEWASILLVTQTGFHLKQPIMCSAANMAYRKNAFMSVGGYSGNIQHLSGDDEFMLKKINKRYGGNATVFLNSPSALVKTEAAKSWSELLNQRIRWASKWSIHRSVTHAFAAVSPLLVQILFLSVFLGFIWKENWGWVVFYVWGSKFLADFLSLGKVLIKLEISVPLHAVLLTSLIHPFFVITTAISTFGGKFSWKGRLNSVKA